MADLWTVNQNDGDSADLSRGDDRKHVHRPVEMDRDQFLQWLKPDSVISGAALAIWFNE